MTPAYDGWHIDGSAYTEVIDLARTAPGWLDTLISVWSTYGLALFALLMVAGWWRARRAGTPEVVTALAVPLITLLAFGGDALLKLAVREDRPCQILKVPTLEACPAHGDWSFPSNHSALAAAAAVALLFVSRRLGILALVAAVLMTASRVWVGVHYPHDVLAGFLVGASVAFVSAWGVRRNQRALAERLKSGPLRPLVAGT
ncbi:phosphatase PAP2 family protein [Streptomyces sp. NBC_00322]|uniref:phosphatase PAP2 family protein n=1 Tax=Streptomyces sp. NBC_00322 TaxID=2975712 RepID=UPI002E2D0BB5|nr:phosphatase PAP2 family protein [Streptomyces sp. NBC_00322]